MNILRAISAFFRRVLHLYRSYRGKCPHCGKKLEWNINRNIKSCPDGHYGVEKIGPNKILIHDNNGDPIDLLFDRNFKLIKGDK